ncbi:MAG: hypothetical protein K2N23_04840, partial [Clostridia bacterium]|nr:hypothetical protein [Clostridia bacterium]
MFTKFRNQLLIILSAVLASLLIVAGVFFFVPKTTAQADAEETHDHSAMTAINSYADIENGELTAGAYYLTDNIDGNISVTGEVTLCLNGHTITGDGNGSVITVSDGATFTLCDCQETGIITGGIGTVTGSGVLGGAVCVLSNASFEMSGGTISGNTADFGG